MTLSPSERYLQRRFLDSGDGTDVDEAFEDATDAARVEYGLSGIIASVASLSAGDVKVVAEDPLPLARVITLARRSFDEDSNQARAYALASDSQFKRRRVTLKVTDDLELGSKVGVLSELDPELEAELLSRLAAEGVTLGAGEFLEMVELRSYRARYKPVVTPHPGRNKNLFVATLKGSPTVLASGATAGEARRNAVSRAKEGPVEGLERYTLEVSVTARRDDGSALFEIERTRLSQAANLRLTLSSAKKPVLKTTGWLFAGRLDSEQLTQED